MYFETFCVLALVCGVLSYTLRATPAQAASVSKSTDFRRFQWAYLPVFLLLMTGDWLQGPYVYALYQHYNYDTNDIAVLFIAGFLSSAVFVTVIGSFADTIGRKRSAIFFCLIYAISCLTKLSPNFNILLVGRILAGIATSLLFSVPEAWMVCEHNKQAFPENLLSDTFAWATFGNGLVAILSGAIANWSADAFGLVAPFMVAIGMFGAAAALITTSWTENFGQVENQNWLTSLKTGIAASRADVKILSIGLIQSLFEGAMYSFVFMWTPALQREYEQRGQHSKESLPFGWIFATFMVSVMIGSVIFGSLSKNQSVEKMAPPVYLIGAIALLVPAITIDSTLTFASFIVFEAVCGMHWPLVGTLRGKYIPEDSRSAVMNLMRLPLNIIVVVVLLKVASMEISTVFWICSALVFVCFGFTFTLPAQPKILKPPTQI